MSTSDLARSPGGIGDGGKGETLNGTSTRQELSWRLPRMVNGATVGYVTMAFDPETRIGWIHNLAVHADLRGQGLGRRLIEHALDRFRLRE